MKAEIAEARRLKDLGEGDGSPLEVTVKAGSGWTDMGQYASAFGKGLNYHYFIFSKGGFTEGLLQAQDRGEVRLLTLADIFK